MASYHQYTICANYQAYAAPFKGRLIPIYLLEANYILHLYYIIIVRGTVSSCDRGITFINGY